MKILRNQLDTITWADIEQLCFDAVGEGLELELKSDLPAKKGLTLDDWHNGGSVGDYARNQIAEEIVAFANTMGGVVVIGIDETSDHPHRAARPHPLPRVHDLARRLRQAVHDMTDPPLPFLEAVGIELAGGSGAVIIRVAESRRKPHRHLANKDVFIRRADESVRIGMREIQELTIRSVAEAGRVETVIGKRRAAFQTGLRDWGRQRSDTGVPRFPGGGMHFVGVPTTTFDLGRVVGRSDLVRPAPTIVARFGEHAVPCTWAFTRSMVWRPSLRSVTALYENIAVKAEYLLQTDGLCEIRVFYGNVADGRQGMFVGWIVAGLGYMLNWIAAIQNGADAAGAEFALAPLIASVGADAILAEYGATNFSEARGARIPAGFHEFPILSVGGADEFVQHLVRFDEDIWNLAGEDIQRNAPKFEWS